MSFRSNPSQQITFADSMWGLTAREQKFLEKSWAKVFAEDLFPNIDEERFRVLYSDKASRPNTPVNVIIGALILKEMFDLSDDEVVENLMLDIRWQYALHTTSFEEQPLSDKSLSRFRTRCYAYEAIHGVDLYHDCVKEYSSAMAKIMKIDGKIRRMDSTMIDANIRKLSRMELLYTCIAKLVKYLSDVLQEESLEEFQHYLDPDDYNKFIYHSRSSQTDERMLTLLKDADKLIELCNGGYDDVTEYQLFVRCMSEQTIVENAVRRLKTKEDGEMGSDILQNPSDPDATYRKKAGKEHRGYVANIEESVGAEGSIVTDYQFRTNNTSDDAMLKEYLDAMDVQEEPVVMAVDGAYGSMENLELAAGKNMELTPTALSGKQTDPFMKGFEFNEKGDRVIKCPAGYEPRTCNYNRQTGQCNISFDRDKCIGCAFLQQCRPKLFKRVAKKTVSRKSVLRAQYQEKMDMERFRLLARLRNGAETIPSMLKNRLHANDMPVHGLQRSKFCFGSKIGALNFKKLLRYRRGTGNYAQNPLLA